MLLEKRRPAAMCVGAPEWNASVEVIAAPLQRYVSRPKNARGEERRGTTLLVI
jgi:hypothetical protein